jgi:hypothetical protein
MEEQKENIVIEYSGEPFDFNQKNVHLFKLCPNLLVMA